MPCFIRILPAAWKLGTIPQPATATCLNKRLAGNDAEGDLIDGVE